MARELADALGQLVRIEVPDEHHRAHAQREEVRDRRPARAAIHHLDERRQAARTQEPLERGDLGDGGGVGEILQAHADGRGALAAQVERMGVRREAGLRQRGAHALDIFFAQAGPAVQHARHRAAGQSHVAGVSPTSASISATRASTCAFDVPRRVSGSAMFAAAVRHGSRLSCCVM